ncbi:MAG: 30S ribosomal protein S5 [Methanobacteriota archaeon]|nr:MAG: 30S ribosomal protein S5 [Euryarchaeota archaeon]
MEEAAAVDDWEPVTKLGRMVKEGRINSLSEIFSQGMPIMEEGIIDRLVPELQEEVIDINLVQRMHKSGRRVRFRATVVVGDGKGYIGFGKAKAKEVGPAIRKAISAAKLNMIEVKQGCGSWECRCGTEHSVPFRVTGKSGSVRVTLLPAPKGIGIVGSAVIKKILLIAGIRDVWVSTSGDTRTKVNSAQATFEALKRISQVKIPPVKGGEKAAEAVD